MGRGPGGWACLLRWPPSTWAPPLPGPSSPQACRSRCSSSMLSSMMVRSAAKLTSNTWSKPGGRESVRVTGRVGGEERAPQADDRAAEHGMRGAKRCKRAARALTQPPLRGHHLARGDAARAQPQLLADGHPHRRGSHAHHHLLWGQCRAAAQASPGESGGAESQAQSRPRCAACPPPPPPTHPPTHTHTQARSSPCACSPAHPAPVATRSAR
jgi:hypothetical protein